MADLISDDEKRAIDAAVQADPWAFIDAHLDNAQNGPSMFGFLADAAERFARENGAA